MKPRIALTYLLAALTLFGYGGGLLLIAAAASPTGPALAALFQRVDLRSMAFAMAIWVSGFLVWTIPHPNFKDLTPYHFRRFLAHSLIILAAMILSLQIGWVHFFDPVTRAVSWGGLFLATLPSLRSVSGWVLRLFFLSFHHTVFPRGLKADQLVAAVPHFSTETEFLERANQCQGQARRFDLHLGLLVIAFKPEQMAQMPKHPLVEKPLLHQILFLLTELNRNYEPWTYLPKSCVFVNVLLLTGPHHVGPITDRFARVLREKIVDDQGQPIGFKILALRKKPEPVPLPGQVQEITLKQWIDGAVSAVQTQTEPMHIHVETGNG